MNQEDELLKRLFAEGEIQPSSELTEKVMHRIDVDPAAFKYEPIISKKVWIILGSIFSLVMIYLVANASGTAFQVPEFVQTLKNHLTDFEFNFSIEYTQPSLPEIPSTLLTALAAINVIGVYLIISYRWRNSLFK